MTIFYTNAIKDYDYHFVTELDPDIGRFTSGIDSDKPVRKIMMNGSDWQIQSQRDRYHSGLYPSLSEEELTEWTEYGWFIPRAVCSNCRGLGTVPNLNDHELNVRTTCSVCGGSGDAGDEIVAVADIEPPPSPSGYGCPDCGSAAGQDDEGTTCRVCGRGMVVDLSDDSPNDDELDYISGTAPGTWCADEKGE